MINYQFAVEKPDLSHTVYTLKMPLNAVTFYNTIHTLQWTRPKGSFAPARHYRL